MAVHRPELPLAGERSLADGYVRVNRCRGCGIVIGFGDKCEVCLDPTTNSIDSPGEYRGRHHTEWAATVDELIIEGDDDAAEFLLLRLVDAAEAEANVAGVPPFERHFHRLAQIAHRRGDTKLEAQVKARYDDCARSATDRGHRAAG
jgi:hypothetical protein